MSDTSKHVVLVHRYFVPDVATYGRMLARFADHLADNGHSVTVLCGPTGYRNALDEADRDQRPNVSVHRFSGSASAPRALDFVWFAINVLTWSLRNRRRIDVISASTMPPVIMGLVLRIVATLSPKIRTVYHCMDIHPEVLGRSNSVASRMVRHVLRAIDTRTMQAIDEIIVLSTDMQNTIAARGVSESTVANNFSLEPIENATKDKEWSRRDGVARIVFAGNLGRFQGLASLCDAVELANNEVDIELVFAGSGPMAADIEQRASTTPSIRLLPHMPIEDAMSLTLDADAAVVSLAPGVIRCSYPSKVLMLLELGSPMLAVVESDSELAQLITEEGLGVVVEPDDAHAASRAMIKLVTMDVDNDHVRTVGRQLHGVQATLDRWTASYLG